MPAGRAMPPEHRKVIVACGVGALFEWYDFYLYGVLAPILALHFFAVPGERAALVATLLAFAAGFVVRPLGALVFGRLGDLIGRKYTFLVTLLLMGGATFVIGLVPGRETLGLVAPVALVVLRLLQGLAIGGEYGGVATYVAEHAPQGRRGYYTGWIQTTASLGLLLALVVVTSVRSAMGEAAFADWGWRLPFLASIVLVALGIWVRLSLDESPLFLKLKRAGRASRQPLAEAFTRAANLRRVVAVLFGLVAAQAVVWYTGQFQALYFMTLQLKVDETSASVMMIVALALGAPLFVVFGALSDRIGRKPVILGGALLAAVAYLPLFGALMNAANPALAEAREHVTVTLVGARDACGAFDPVGIAAPQNGCVAARRWLADRAVRYAFVEGKGPAVVVEQQQVDVAAGDSAARARLDRALNDAGYPVHADPGRIERTRVVAILFALIVLVTMVYGPIAAILVETFPTRVRCSSVSLPYHIGNGWFGGLLPSAMIAVGTLTGSPFAGLWIAIGIAAAGALVGLFVVSETKDDSLEAHDQDYDGQARGVSAGVHQRRLASTQREENR